MTVWSAHLYDPEHEFAGAFGVEDTIEDAQDLAVESLAGEIPDGATWMPHGSHRHVLMLDGSPVTVRRDNTLAQVVVAEREIPGVLVP